MTIPGLYLLISLFLHACNDGPGDSGTENPPVINPQVKSGTIWAASSAPFIGETGSGIASWQRLNNRLKAANGGHGLIGRRTYDKGIPVSFSESAMVDDIGNCKVSLGSFKPNWIETMNGTNNEAIGKFVRSIPDDRTVYLTFYHEPEDNVSSTYTIDVFQKAFARFVEIVLTTGKPNVHPCFVLMTWTFKPESGRNPDNYNMAKYLKPDQVSKVIAGVDGYANDPAISAKVIFEPGFTKMKSWGFTRFGIFETGAHASSVPSARSAWVTGLGEWVNSRHDIELVSWFNNGNGQHAGPTGWYLGTWQVNGNTYSWDDSDGTLEAFAKLLKP